MLGSITEKPASTVSGIIVGSCGGFPVSRKLQTARSYQTLDPNGLKLIAALKSHHEPSSEELKSPEYDENDSMILTMSHQDRLEALEEITSLISPKNIAFLKKMPNLNVDEVDKVALPKLPRKITENIRREMLIASEPVVVAPSRASNECPEAVDIFDTKIRESLPSLPGRNHALLNERFDLNGRRIVDFSSMTKVVHAELESSGAVDAAHIDSVCVICIDAVRSLSSASTTEGFVLSLDQASGAAQGQPQDELRHHQYQGEVPGYNFTEMGEMFRSQFASQRVVALRMLSGVLLRRDCVVALEAYSGLYRSGGDVRGGCSTALDPPQLVDEVGRKSSMMVALSDVYERAVARVQQLILLGSAVAEPTSTPESRARKLVVHCFLQVICCSDLPVELPTLLLWALGCGSMRPSGGTTSSQQQQQQQQAGDGGEDEAALAPSFGLSGASVHNPIAAKLALLRCVSMYLHSPVEEQAVSILRDSSLLWPSCGCPRLPTPHARRPHAPYEQHMRDCADRAVRFLGGEDDEEGVGEQAGCTGPQSQSAPESVLEAFALQCRWSRIDALCSRSSLIVQLFGHAICAAEIIVNDAEVGAQGTTDRVPQLSASTEAHLALGRDALDLLVAVARQGGKEAAGQVARQLVRAPTWRVVIGSLSVEATALSASLQQIALALKCMWWRVIDEAVMRDRAAALRLWGMEEGLSSLLLRRILAALESPTQPAVEPREALLVCTLLRSSTCYGLGLGCITELLLALKLQGGGLLPLDSPLAAAVLLLLEQASVTCAAAVNRGSAALLHVTRGGGGEGGRGDRQVSLPTEEALQAASAILSFLVQHLALFNEALLGSSNHTDPSAKGAALSLICTVLVDAIPAVASADLQSVSNCSYQLLTAELRRAAELRGPGLVVSLVHFATQQVAAQQKEACGSGSVGAGTVHVSGQCAELVQLCRGTGLFSMEALRPGIARAVVSCEQGLGGRGSGGVGAAEVVLLWQQWVSIAYHVGIRDELSLGAAIKLSNECARGLGAAQHLRGETEAPAVHSARVLDGTVSNGMLNWQICRVQQASFFAQLSLAVHADRKDILLSFLADHLGGPAAGSLFLAPKLAAVARSYVRYVVSACAPSSSLSASEGTLVQHTAEQRHALLVQEHALLSDFVCDIVLAGFADKYFGAALDPGESASEWLTYNPTSRNQAPSPAVACQLKRSWAFDVLGSTAMRGAHLSTWLAVLAHLCADSSSNSSDSNSSCGASSAVTVGSAILLAERVFALLKLSAADQASKWRGAVEGGEQEDLECCDADAAAVAAYRALLQSLLLSTLVVGVDEFCLSFCAVTAKEFAEGPGMLAALKRIKAVRSLAASRRTQQQPRVVLDGAMDLGEKALDAAMNQTIDAGVHSAALLVLASPCMPWALRQRIWAQLAEVGLAHLLLEDAQSVQQLLSVLVGEHCGSAGLRESAALYVDMASALAGLRCPSDRQFGMVKVSVLQMAQFIFSPAGAVRQTTLQGSAAHVLTHLQQLLRSGSEGARWLVGTVLDAAAMLLESPVSPQSVLQENPSTVQHATDNTSGELVPANLRDLAVVMPSSSSGSKCVVPLTEFLTV